MYSIEQLQGRIIWLFKEPRSGSGWLHYCLSLKFNREPYNFNFTEIPYNIHRFNTVKPIYENRTEQEDDCKKLLHTHDFEALFGLKNYRSPIVLRTTRRNKTEQILSLIIAEKTNIFFLNRGKRSNKTEVENVYSNLEPFNAPLNIIKSIIKSHKFVEKLWQENALLYENETFYYEDLVAGYKSKLFDVDVCMDENDNRLQLKLPYDKREFITNYDEVDKIITEAFGQY